MILPLFAWHLASVLVAMVFFATFNRWAGALALSFPLVWGGPPVAHRPSMWLAGKTERFEVFASDRRAVRAQGFAGRPSGRRASPCRKYSRRRHAWSRLRLWRRGD